MHRHTRLILILSTATLLATGSVLWLLWYSGSLRVPAVAVRSAVADAAPQGQALPADAAADGAARATFTSPDGSPAPAAAQQDIIDPDAAEQANWHAVQLQQLAFEQGVVVPGGLSQQGSDALLRAENFAQRMVEAGVESGRDADAADVTRVYREAIERSLRESGSRARLSGLACGTQLCVGMLIGGRGDDYKAWSEAFPKRGDAPTYAMNVHDAADAGGAPALRFAFTVDPAFGGMVVEGV